MSNEQFCNDVQGSNCFITLIKSTFLGHFCCFCNLIRPIMIKLLFYLLALNYKWYVFLSVYVSTYFTNLKVVIRKYSKNKLILKIVFFSDCQLQSMSPLLHPSFHLGLTIFTIINFQNHLQIFLLIFLCFYWCPPVV